MKRDWETVKCVLAQVEKQPHGSWVYYKLGEETQLFMHAVLLADDNCLRVAEQTDTKIAIIRLTMRGHDLLDRLRNPDVKGPGLHSPD